jgi:hypothetical protein
MPSALLRLFSIQDNPSQSINNDEREQELKKTLGILGKPALSVTELEKQFLQPLSINNSVSSCALTNAIQDWTTSNQNLLNGISPSNHQIQFESNGHLMTPAEFQTFRIPQSPGIKSFSNPSIHHFIYFFSSYRTCTNQFHILMFSLSE